MGPGLGYQLAQQNLASAAYQRMLLNNPTSGAEWIFTPRVIRFVDQALRVAGGHSYLGKVVGRVRLNHSGSPRSHTSRREVTVRVGVHFGHTRTLLGPILDRVLQDA